MIIKATATTPSSLDLSSMERMQEENTQEAKTFRLTIHPGQQIEVDDQWFVLKRIQEALRLGYIEILDNTLSNDLLGEYWQVATVAARNAIPLRKRREGMACWVMADSRLYHLVGGVDNANWVGDIKITVGTMPPLNPDINDLWIDTN